MKILILYNSRKGHTRDSAEAMAAAGRDLKHAITLKSIIEVSTADVEDADVILIGTWIQGFILFGVKPAGADLWVPSLPSLAGKRVGIFCTYAFHPHNSLNKLATLLTARGATVMGQRAFHRRRPRQGAEGFVQEVLRVVQ